MSRDVLITPLPSHSDDEETRMAATATDLEKDFLLFQSLVGNKSSSAS